jgi:copper homeostasis protein
MFFTLLINIQALAYTIEIAVTDYTSAASAVKGGADRIELCSALSEGGLTASHGLIEKCKNDFDIPLFPIIRPRAGDFLYSEEEFDIMLKDVLFCKQSGVDGIVTGFLLPDGNIDRERISIITELVYPMQVTFHRAFDRCLDPFKGLEDIIESGCSRILTSAQQLKAIEGTTLIKQLIEAAKERIIIMPGSGVRKENIKELAEKTGATEFHSSLKSVSKSKMKFIHPTFAGLEEECFNAAIDPEEVQALRKALLYSIH